MLPPLARAQARQTCLVASAGGGSPRGLRLWLLTLHPFAAGRTYAAYGGVYIIVALAWLWAVEGVTPTPWDAVGAAVALAGMAIIAMQR
ncbi:putative protein UPF0060 [Aromatoleum bremense]|nr:putative protein UPF0060 [Aromatoleum bremense]